ncbi:MAG TPA: ROK family protein [Acidobacteriota bacterium]|nr:ROK family protein [Acidobacteriota bacterium]
MNIHLGIDIGGTWLKYGAIDTEGRILLSDRAATRGPEGEAGAVERIVDCARRMVAWASEAEFTPVSVGIGSPGTVHAQTLLVQPPTPNLTVIIGVDLARLVREATGLPTAIDNDANCAAWGEYRYGAGRGIDNLICITVGSGIGSGFVVDGRIFSGPTGSGAELGHVTIDWQGPPCACGNRGCLENYTSANALLRRANDAADRDRDSRLCALRESSNGALSIADLFRAAREGDAVARAILDQGADLLARGILNAINLFDPEAVVIGGGVADADTDGTWLAKVRDGIHRHAFSAEGKTLRVGKAAFGNDAGFIGAAALGALAVNSESRC